MGAIRNFRGDVTWGISGRLLQASAPVGGMVALTAATKNCSLVSTTYRPVTRISPRMLMGGIPPRSCQAIPRDGNGNARLDTPIFQQQTGEPVKTQDAPIAPTTLFGVVSTTYFPFIQRSLRRRTDGIRQPFFPGAERKSTGSVLAGISFQWHLINALVRVKVVHTVPRADTREIRQRGST